MESDDDYDFDFVGSALRTADQGINQCKQLFSDKKKSKPKKLMTTWKRELEVKFPAAKVSRRDSNSNLPGCSNNETIDTSAINNVTLTGQSSDPPTSSPFFQEASSSTEPSSEPMVIISGEIEEVSKEANPNTTRGAPPTQDEPEDSTAESRSNSNASFGAGPEEMPTTSAVNRKRKTTPEASTAPRRSARLGTKTPQAWDKRLKVGKKTKAKESAVESVENSENMENEDHPHSLEDQTGNSTGASVLLNQIEISQEEDGTVQVSAPEESGTPLVLLTNARQPIEVQTPSVSSSGQELVEIIATTTNDTDQDQKLEDSSSGLVSVETSGLVVVETSGLEVVVTTNSQEGEEPPSTEAQDAAGTKDEDQEIVVDNERLYQLYHPQESRDLQADAIYDVVEEVVAGPSMPNVPTHQQNSRVDDDNVELVEEVVTPNSASKPANLLNRTISFEDEIETKNIKIRWKYEIVRIIIKETDTLGTLFDHFAEQIGLDSASTLTFSLDGKVLRRFDTYKSAGLLVTSFIDASQRVPEDEINIVDEAGAAAKEKEGQSNEGKIELKFQSDRRRGAEMIWVAKDERFEGIMARYAAKAGVDLTALKFLFDGEPLGRLDTPLDLDLEGGECIDVHVDAKSARKPPPPPRPTNVNVLDNPENFSNTSNSFVARFAAQRAAAQTNEASRPVAGANNQQEPQQPQPPQRGSIRWKIAPTRTRKRGGRR